MASPDTIPSPQPSNGSMSVIDPRKQPKVTAKFALERTQLVIAAYGAWRPDDAELYIASIVETLTEYCSEIVRHVTDPRTGVQAHSRYLPAVSHVRDACAEQFDAMLRVYEAAIEPARRRTEFERMQKEAAERCTRMTYREMLKKFGFEGRQWLPPMRDPLRDRLRGEIAERDTIANAEFIKREYQIHGYVPVIWKGKPITLSLALQLQLLGKLTIERSR